MVENSTRELIRRAKTGDAKALDTLLKTHRDRLEGYVRLRVGAHLRTRLEVDDVLQETFAKAVEGIEGFQWRGADSFLRWLKRIAENVILAEASKGHRHEILLLEEHDPLADEVSPSRGIRRQERRDHLQQALNQLSPEHREVIVLARFKGLRHNEIAARMNRSPNAVAHLLARALERLKSIFGDTESLSLPSQQPGEPDETRGHDGDGQPT